MLLRSPSVDEEEEEQEDEAVSGAALGYWDATVREEEEE